MAILKADAPAFFYRNLSTQPHPFHPFHGANQYYLTIPFPTCGPAFCNPPCFSCLIPFLHHPQIVPYSDPFYFYQSPPPSIQYLFPYTSTSTSQLHETEVEKGVVSENLVSKPSSQGFLKRHDGFQRSYRRRSFENHQHNKKKWIPKEASVVVEETSVGLNLDKEKEQLQPFRSEAVEPHGVKTSVMIRNIPNKYTREMLLEFLDNHCDKENRKLDCTQRKENESAYDFLYLPIDFESKCNKGYAFVNFTLPMAASKLYDALNNYRWDILSSKKICEITYARIQGKQALIDHFQQSTFFCEKDDYLPVYFEPCRDGSGELVKQFSVGRRLNPPVKNFLQICAP